MKASRSKSWASGLWNYWTLGDREKAPRFFFLFVIYYSVWLGWNANFMCWTSRGVVTDWPCTVLAPVLVCIIPLVFSSWSPKRIKFDYFHHINQWFNIIVANGCCCPRGLFYCDSLIFWISLMFSQWDHLNMKYWKLRYIPAFLPHIVIQLISSSRFKVW